MRKVLILAYDFPPFNSVAGLRPFSWLKYFNEFGIYPIIITRQWASSGHGALNYVNKSKSDNVIVEKTDNGCVLSTPYKPTLANKLLIKFGEEKFKLIRKILTGGLEILQYLFKCGSKIEFYKQGEICLSQYKIDVIIATGDPFVLFHYASLLSTKYKVPWIADYRDPWSNDVKFKDGGWLSLIFREIEKKSLKNVNKIVTVQEYFKSKIKEVVKDGDIHIIENGYEINYNNANSLESKNFRIIYSGTIYDWHPFKSFIRTFCDWVENYNIRNIKLDFYGTSKSKELRRIVEYKYLKNHIINVHDRIPHKDLVQKLVNADVLLLFNDYSIVGSKVYEYMALRKPILLCYDGYDPVLGLATNYFDKNSLKISEQKSLILKTRSGIPVTSPNHLEEILTKLYNGFNFELTFQNIEQYSRKASVAKYAELINNICNE